VFLNPSGPFGRQHGQVAVGDFDGLQHLRLQVLGVLGGGGRAGLGLALTKEDRGAFGRAIRRGGLDRGGGGAWGAGRRGGRVGGAGERIGGGEPRVRRGHVRLVFLGCKFDLFGRQTGPS